ncbi:MAG: prolyl oligopeptidase family serine peptidase [Candidatus Anammoximicrobium sp.]|nr:prolyl oligopeptidase family serine peptidase [Candidatus Anammoximicrobium sp.]
MLIVGELDENVEPASTMQVAHALQRADTGFELVVVAGAGHGGDPVRIPLPGGFPQAAPAGHGPVTASPPCWKPPGLSQRLSSGSRESLNTGAVRGARGDPSDRAWAGLRSPSRRGPRSSAGSSR